MRHSSRPKHHIQTLGGFPIASTPDASEHTEANAQFIVTACNWHDEAREALTEIALLCEIETDWLEILRRANSALEGLAKQQSVQAKAEVPTNPHYIEYLRDQGK